MKRAHAVSWLVHAPLLDLQALVRGRGETFSLRSISIRRTEGFVALRLIGMILEHRTVAAAKWVSRSGTTRGSSNHKHPLASTYFLKQVSILLIFEILSIPLNFVWSV